MVRMELSDQGREPEQVADGEAEAHGWSLDRLWPAIGASRTGDRATRQRLLQVADTFRTTSSMPQVNGT
jgi:hypothetical protein